MPAMPVDLATEKAKHGRREFDESLKYYLFIINNQENISLSKLNNTDYTDYNKMKIPKFGFRMKNILMAAIMAWQAW